MNAPSERRIDPPDVNVVTDDELLCLSIQAEADERNIRAQIIAYATGVDKRDGAWRSRAESALRYIVRFRRRIEAEQKVRINQAKEARRQADREAQERNRATRQGIDDQALRNLYFYRAAKRLLPKEVIGQLWERARQFQPEASCWSERAPGENA